MKAVKITKVYKSKRGHYLVKQECQFFMTEKNEPAIHAQWQSASLFGSSREEVLVFPAQVSKFGLLSDEITLGHAKSFISSRKVVPSLRGVAGLLTLGIDIAAGEIRARSASIEGKRGFFAFYRNLVGDEAMFVGIADVDVVELIMRSLPVGIIQKQK